MSALVQGGHVFAEEKHSGRLQIVGEEEMLILVGWIFSETNKGEIITLDDAWTEATEYLELNVVKEPLDFTSMSKQGVQQHQSQWKRKYAMSKILSRSYVFKKIQFCALLTLLTLLTVQLPQHPLLVEEEKVARRKQFRGSQIVL